MNQQTRERALRALTAGLLNSGLTPQEIREVSRSLMSDPSLIEQVARLAGLLAESLLPPAKPKPIPLKATQTAQMEPEEFIREAETVGLSTSDLVNRLRSYAQRTDWNPSLKSTRHRILKSFLRVAPPSSWRAALVSLKAGPVEPDQYVEFILNHNKANHG
jgi:hypothetical protein